MCLFLGHSGYTHVCACIYMHLCALKVHVSVGVGVLACIPLLSLGHWEGQGQSPHLQESKEGLHTVS